MTDQLTYPDVVSLAVPFFIAAILIELLWITTQKRGEIRDTIEGMGWSAEWTDRGRDWMDKGRVP